MPPPRRALALIFILFSIATGSFAQTAPTWQRIAEQGRLLSAEASWTLAIEQLQAALDAAPADADTRPLQLELAQAQLALAQNQRDWQRRRSQTEAVATTLLNLIAESEVTETELPVADFELAVLATLVKAEQPYDHSSAWGLLKTVGHRLGVQPASSNNTRRLADFLRPLVSSRAFSTHQFAEIHPLLRAIRDHATDPEQRAWAAYELADSATSAEVSVERVAAWKTARKLSRDTDLAATVDTAWFLWRVQTGWKPDSELGHATDIDALIDEAQTLHARLELSPVEELKNTYLRQLTRHLNSWREPQFRLEADDHFLPDAPISFIYAATRVQHIKFELMRLPISPIFADWQRQTRRDFAPSGEVVQSWTQTIDTASESAWVSDVHEFKPRLSPGCYVLLATAQSTTTGGFLNRCERFTVGAYQAHWILPRLPDEPTELLLTDARTQAPIPHMAVHGLTHEANRRVREWSLKTDANGRARGDLLPIAAGNHRVEFSFVAEADGHALQCHSAVTELADPLVADLIVDRPLYRPGETVHWKLILRERRDSRWTVPAHHAHLEAIDGKGGMLLKLNDQELDAYGTLDGSIELPLDVGIGDVRFSLQLSNGRSAHLPTLCRVDNYVPPALTAAISYAGAASGLRSDYDIPIKVSAHYLSGGPAVGAKVTLNISESPRSNRVLETLVGTTDAAGEVELNWHSVATSRINLHAEVLPRGGQPVSTESTWCLSSTGLFTSADEDDRPTIARPGEEVSFTGRIEDGTGTPRAFHGEARLVQLRWQEFYRKPTGEIVNYHALPPDTPPQRLPDGWLRFHARYLETEVATQSLETDAAGHYDLTFAAPDPGLYQLRIFDPTGQALHAPVPAFMPYTWQRRARNLRPADRYSLVVFDATTTSLPVPSHQEQVFVAAKLPANASASAIVTRGRAEQSMLLTIVRESQTTTHVLPAGSLLEEIDLSSFTQIAGPGQLMLFTLEGRLVSTTPFTVQPATDPFSLEISAPLSAHPGETVRVDAQTSSATPAQLLHLVTDEAVLQLAATDDVRAKAPLASVFNDTSPFTGAKVQASLAATEQEPRPLPDPRPGAIVSTTSSSGPAGEGEILLSAFYASSATLAGSRLTTEMHDSASAPPRFDRSPLSTANGVIDNTISSATPEAAPIRLRRHFASTAAWIPAQATDDHGHTEFSYTLPDNLTAWRLSTYALSADGLHAATTQTTLRSTLPLQARLQTPRFLIAGDTAQPSIAVVNRTATNATANVSLLVEGEAASLAESPPINQTVNVPAEGETAVTWELQAHHPGLLQLTGTAHTNNDADGMVIPLEVQEDGLQQHLAASARLTPDARRISASLKLPDPLDPTRTTAHLELSTSPAIAALDALPYLINYPYGCVEQTMSRFLPAIVVRDSLTRLGLEATEVEARILTGETDADARRRKHSAGLGQLDEVAQRSLQRLAEAQTSHGGWGWWPQVRQDDPWMTAYVTWGLGLAEQAGLSVPADMFNRANARCAQIAATVEHDLDARAWALQAATAFDPALNQLDVPAVLAAIFAQRDQLSPSARAAFALVVARIGTAEQRDVILRNLVNHTVRETSDLGTLVHWGSVRGHWHALHGAHEATAMSLLALQALDPTHELIEPAIAWLSLNRRSAHWESTRATTFAVLALMRHLDASDAATAVELDVRLNRNKLTTLTLSPASLLDQPLRVALPLEQLRSGTNQIELRRRDKRHRTPVFATALASAWATGDAVQPASHVVAAERVFDRQVGTPTVLGPTRFMPETLPTAGTIVATEQVDARVALHIPHALHYLMIKVPRPAGCEPLNPLSDWDVRLEKISDDDEVLLPWERARVLYREEHNDHSAVFINHIEPGDWVITVPFRAVTPGDYRALPATIEAMYVPEITANSDARRIQITPN